MPLTLTSIIKDPPDAPEIDLCVVRLQTAIWRDKRGVYQKKSLTYLRRQCKNFNILEEDVCQIGAEDAMDSIINLYECQDGIYTITACNIHRNWESGHVDGYDLQLLPYTPPTQNNET